MKVNISISIDPQLLAALDVIIKVDKTKRSQAIESALRTFLTKKEASLPTPTVKAIKTITTGHRAPKKGHTVNLEVDKPWEKLNISRRTWYRRYRQVQK